jgi:hypothetical protein
MPVNDPKYLLPPVKYKTRPVARQLSRAEIKAAADRAEARSTAQAQFTKRGRSGGDEDDRGMNPKHSLARRSRSATCASLACVV